MQQYIENTHQENKCETLSTLSNCTLWN